MSFTMIYLLLHNNSWSCRLSPPFFEFPFTKYSKGACYSFQSRTHFRIFRSYEVPVALCVIPCISQNVSFHALNAYQCIPPSRMIDIRSEMMKPCFMNCWSKYSSASFITLHYDAEYNHFLNRLYRSQFVSDTLHCDAGS